MGSMSYLMKLGPSSVQICGVLMIRKGSHIHSCMGQLSFVCFYSYGKAAFCLEELMMTNPHNHLYCEQYAEVSVPVIS